RCGRPGRGTSAGRRRAAGPPAAVARAATAPDRARWRPAPHFRTAHRSPVPPILRPRIEVWQDSATRPTVPNGFQDRGRGVGWWGTIVHGLRGGGPLAAWVAVPRRRSDEPAPTEQQDRAQRVAPDPGTPWGPIVARVAGPWAHAGNAAIARLLSGT